RRWPPSACAPIRFTGTGTTRSFPPDRQRDRTWSTYFAAGPKPGTNEVVGAYVYEVIAAGIGLADDRAGGIRYDGALASAAFAVRITRNSRWAGMTDTQRGAIEAQCELRWGPAGYLDFSRGSWVSERTYSKDGYGVGRQRFAAW
ncbi:MAG: hypothetical protein ACREM3_24860, partial [Candidatus Rokuibacteriota bacterium]